MLVCCAWGAWGQAPEPVPVPSTIPTLRITVTLVQVDAVVTDSSGRHVMDLGPGDFEILQDGESRPITFFSRVPGTPPQPIKPAAIDGVPAPLISTALTSAAQVKRAVALVVDDLALSFSDLVRTRDALKRYVEQQMQPGDLVAVVRTGGGIAILEQFTTDKRLLLESINTLKWRFAGRQGLTPLKSSAGGSGARPDKPEFLGYDYTLSALGALGTVEQVIEGMRKLPGRKSVVFLSDNLRVDGTIHAAVDHLTDLANRSMVSLYAVDPGGLRANMKAMARDPVITGERDAAEMERFPGFPGADLDDETARQEGLEALASRTGGIFYRNRNDIEACIAEAADDQLGYYLLGYSPSEGTFDQKGPAKFHKVTVRVTRPGLKVRWKNGFNGVPDSLTLSEESGGAAKSREQQILEALASPFAATGIKVRLTALYMEPKQYGPIVHSMLHFEGKDIGFRQEPDGTWHASLDVVWSAYRGVKNPIWQGEQPQDIRLPEEQYRRALKEGFVLPISIRPKATGTFLLRAVVRDAATQRIGSASQFVDVPDTRKGQFAISGISLRMATKAVLASIGAPSGPEAEGWTEGGPATRRYRPGQSIVYGFQVINPKIKGQQKEPRIAYQLRVFRDGRLMYTGPESHSLSTVAFDDGRVMCGGVLRLGGALVPGEYLVQVAARDENGKKKAPPLMGWMDFEVVRGDDLAADERR